MTFIVLKSPSRWEESRSRVGMKSALQFCLVYCEASGLILSFVERERPAERERLSRGGYSFTNSPLEMKSACFCGSLLPLGKASESLKDC